MRRFLATIATSSVILLGACTSSPQPQGTVSTPASDQPSTAAPDPTPGPDRSSLEGLLVVESGSGDVVRFEGGSWNQVFDGSAYDDEFASTFAESAASVGSTNGDGIVVSVCCEPVVGALLLVENPAEDPSYVGYGTRPVVVGSRVVSFKIEYDSISQPPQTSLIVSSGTGSDEASESELPLGALHPGHRLIALSDTHVAFTWSQGTDPGAERFLGVVDVSQPDSTMTSTPIPPDTDLAASEVGAIYLFDLVGSTPKLFKVDLHEEGRAELEEMSNLPEGTFSVAVRGSVVVAATDALYSNESGSFELLLAAQPVWVGW